MKDFHYFCFDLDGTLLDDSKRIGDDSKRLIKNLHKKGKTILLASGRHYCETTQYIDELGLISNDIVIVCDGQYIYRGDGTCVWSDNFLTVDDLVEIKDIAAPKEMSIISDLVDYHFVDSFRFYLIDYLKRLVRHRSTSTVMRRIESLPNIIQIEKVILRNVKSDRLPMLESRYCVHCIETDYRRVEILHKDVNKYHALQVLLDKGIIASLDDLVFFGNDMNDAECFRNLEYCVAMADSPEEIKAKAFIITTDCNSDGVAKALSQLF